MDFVYGNQKQHPDEGKMAWKYSVNKTYHGRVVWHDEVICKIIFLMSALSNLTVVKWYFQYFLNPGPLFAWFDV